MPLTVLSVVLGLQVQAGAFQFPTRPLAPAAMALGGTGAVRAGDASASDNPATLLTAPRATVELYQGFAGYRAAVIAGDVALGDRLAVGIDVRRYGWDHLIEDDLGPDANGLDASQIAMSGSVALRVLRVMGVGLSASRMIVDNFGVRTEATAWSTGMVVRYGPAGAVGGAVRNLGSAARTKASDLGYPLPTRLRGGVAQAVALSHQQ